MHEDFKDRGGSRSYLFGPDGQSCSCKKLDEREHHMSYRTRYWTAAIAGVFVVLVLTSPVRVHAQYPVTSTQPDSLSPNGKILLILPTIPDRPPVPPFAAPAGVPSDTVSEPVDFGEQLRAWTVWYFDPYTCQTAGTGTITNSQGPRYGEVTYSVASATIPPGFTCAGYSLPANFAYYTWSILPQTTVIDFFHLHYVSNDQTQVADVDRQPELVGKGQGDPDDQPGGPAAGEPINIGTGNVFDKIIDYQTSGQNKLSFIRYYNSLGVPNTFASELGVNWRSNYDRYVYILGPGRIVVERPDGQLLNFSNGGTKYVSDLDVDYSMLERGTTWTMTDPEDTVESYTQASSNKVLLDSIRLRNGYTQTLHYNSADQLMSVTDTYGRQLLFSYSGNALNTVTTPDGLILTYNYNTIPGGVANQLISASYSTSPPTSQTYQYGDSSLPFALTGIVDEDGNQYVRWSYDQFGRGLTSQLGPGAYATTVIYDDTDGSRTVENAFGVIDTYHFDILQGLPKVSEIDRAATSTTAAATRLFTYDANGYRASQTDWNGNQILYVNDPLGQPTVITEPLRTTTISHDPTFTHLPHQIVTAGLTSTFAYDGSGNLLTRTDTDTTAQNLPYSTHGTTEAWTFTWTNSLLASVRTPRRDVNGLTQFLYDSTGALTQITNALGQQAQITQHTGGGLPLTVVDRNSVITTLSYDGRMRLNTNIVHTGAGNLTTTYNHDAAGNLVSVQRPDGSTLVNNFDTAHRLTSVTDLFGQSIDLTLDQLGDNTMTDIDDSGHTVRRKHSGVFDALGRVLQDIGGMSQATTFTYDNNGNALTITDPLSNITVQVFDALNRLSTVTDPNQGVTRLTYDAHDRPLMVVDSNGGQTTYVYDGFGDVIEQSSPDSGATIYYYDLDGNITKRVAATNAVIQFTYDALDRVTTTTYPSDPRENVAYSYDQSGHGFGIGRLTSVTDAAGFLVRSYDERGNITQEARTTGPGRLLTQYGYDAASRVVSIRYPSGWKTSYSRDSMGRPISIQAQPPSGSAITLASTISYQPFGPVKALSFGNGVSESRTFDLDYRLSDLIDTGNSQIQNLTYSYDLNDNPITIADAVHPANSQALGYDVLNRLKTASGGYGNYSWSYNLVGSRTTETLGQVTTNYSYGSHNNRLLTLDINGVVNQTLGYTADGNANSFAPGIMAPGGEFITELQYDQAGHLSAVMAGATSLDHYTYDAFGQRLAKTPASGVASLYQYDMSGNLLEEALVDGRVPEADYVYLDRGPVAVISPISREVYYLHDDRLGTPQVGTDIGQNIAWDANYLPFGETASVQGTVTQNLRLPGQHFDSESGWNHNGFRDYVQSWGRYLEVDPIGLIGDLEIYRYANANPERFTDPSGLFQFGMRPLAPFRWLGKYGSGSIGNFNIWHENGFFDNGENVGYFEQGIRADDASYFNQYIMYGPYYDDEIIEEALLDLVESRQWQPEGVVNGYTLGYHNCQDFAQSLRAEYFKLGGKTCDHPFFNGACSLQDIKKLVY
jgi:RHS repeat-associated protein